MISALGENLHPISYHLSNLKIYVPLYPSLIAYTGYQPEPSLAREGGPPQWWMSRASY